MDVYEQMFEGFKVSARRLETLPTYHIKGGEWEEYQQYLQGIPIKDFANQDWVEDVGAWKKAGKEIRRIRVIPSTLTRYLRYEFEWCFPENMLAGEVIRVVAQADYQNLVSKATSGDFWIFDEKYVLSMQYDEEGRYLGENLIDNKDLVGAFVALFRELERRSLAYTNIMQQVRQAKLTVEVR